jgi:hypothetical protein
MKAVKKQADRVTFGVQEHALLESIAPGDTDAVPALLKALQDQGGVEELLALLDTVESAAEEVGGLSRLRHCLEALKTLKE